MAIWRSLGVVTAAAVVFALLGGGAGYGMARLLPGYYRSLFRNGSQPEFDPVEVGLGLGFTQGMTAGVLVGLALVALAAWRDVRVAGKNASG